MRLVADGTYHIASMKGHGVWNDVGRGYAFAISRRDFARALQIPCPHPRNRGRRESRVPTAPAVSCAKTHSNRRTRAYRFSRNSPAFPTQWLYGLLRALPGERACLPPSLAKLLHKLSASIAAPGPHDFAVRLGVFVRREKHA